MPRPDLSTVVLSLCLENPVLSGASSTRCFPSHWSVWEKPQAPALPLDHARNECPRVSCHRQSKEKCLLQNKPGKCLVWVSMWNWSMGRCRRCAFPCSSRGERNSRPYLTRPHECPRSGIHCLLTLGIQCTLCTSAREGIKIYCSSQPNIFKIE